MRDFNRSGGNRRGERRSFGGGRGDRPEMFDAICDQCGKSCKVPFRPSGDKPIYCSECFEEKGGNDNRRKDFGDRGRRSFDRGREERQMFSVVCDQCGADCEVPFKPQSSKPVLCSRCFEEKNGKKSSGGCNCDCGNLKADIEALNRKLDRIIDILEPIKEVKATKKAIKKEVDEIVEDIKETAKKVAKKVKTEV